MIKAIKDFGELTTTKGTKIMASKNTCKRRKMILFWRKIYVTMDDEQV